jgi:hypothetical protein
MENHIMKNIVCMSPIGKFSPQFPEFDEFTLDNINTDIRPVVSMYKKNNISINSMLNILNNLEPIRESTTNALTLVLKSSKIINDADDADDADNDSADIVEKTMEIVRVAIFNNRKIATVKVYSEIVFPGNTISWDVQIIFTHYEWNYFLTICDLNILDTLEKSSNICYGNLNIITSDSKQFETLEKFLTELFGNFEY